ncbi:MAG: patatin-like phospholipase family protein [Magnetovibrionaceae bacterium]
MDGKAIHPAKQIPFRSAGKRDKPCRAINIALQGGGAHGAFTWGVLDRLFEDDRLWIEAITGTSAGAMNAVVAAMGMRENGADGARERLRQFWKAVSELGHSSPIQRSWLAKLKGEWSLSDSPSFLFFDILSRLASPYDLNVMDYNPLRDLVREFVDFGKVSACQDMGLFLSATDVKTGRVRIFARQEIDLDAVMASACLPTLFKAVEKDGHHYWDGGYMGNPPLFPFFKNSPSDDILIVQINPVYQDYVPVSAFEIQNRVNEITFNSSLLHELRAIDFVSRLLEAGKLDPAEYRSMKVHMIHAGEGMRHLDASSKLNAEWSFLEHLFEIGRETTDAWLAENFDALGKRSSLDLRQMFDQNAVAPTSFGPL